MILTMDMEGNTWRKIDEPSGLQHSMHQAQGHLCVCTIASPNDSKLSIQILEDYGTNIWTLKHNVSTLKVFEKTNIEFPRHNKEQVPTPSMTSTVTLCSVSKLQIKFDKVFP